MIRIFSISNKIYFYMELLEFSVGSFDRMKRFQKVLEIKRDSSTCVGSHVIIKIKFFNYFVFAVKEDKKRSICSFCLSSSANSSVHSLCCLNLWSSFSCYSFASIFFFSLLSLFLSPSSFRTPLPFPFFLSTVFRR